MKYFITLSIIFLFLSFNAVNSMTTTIYFDDIQKITDINDKGYFSITKTEGAYFSIYLDVISSIKSEKIILSLFLEDSENAKDISEFLIYPVGRISKEAEVKGLIVSTKTKEKDYVNIFLPKNFFDGIENPLGIFIRTTQDSTFFFKGIDQIGGTVNDPHLTIVGEEVKNIEEKQVVLPFNDRKTLQKILENNEKILENTRKKFYEKPYFSYPVGVVFGIFASLIANIFYKKYF